MTIAFASNPNKRTALSQALYQFIPPATSDPYFDYTTLLLPGNGSNGANNNTFLDGSTNNFTITRNGNTTQGTFSPFSQTGWGNYFDGTGDYLTANGGTTANLGTTWTIECWLYPNNVSGTGAIVNVNINTANQGINIYRSGATITVDNGGSAGTGPSGGTLVANTWQHVAVVADGTNTRIYLNGSQVGSTFAGTVTLGTPTHFWIGSSFTGLTAWAGYISNARIVKGVAVYTGAFTPPTSPLAATQSAGTNISAITGTQTSLLTCQSNRFIDNSTNNFTITVNGNTSVVPFSPFNPTSAWSASTVGGSGYFDGTGDQLTIANNSAFDFGTGDFTVEAWCYFTGTSGSPINYSNGQTSNSNFAWDIYQNSATSIQTTIVQGSTGYSASSTALVANAWNHVACVRNGNTLTIYVNGVAGGTTANVTGVTANNPGGATVKISGFNNATGCITGYVSNARIVKGTAVYTGNFTPPTAPITNAGSTSAASYSSTTNVNTSFASSATSLLLNFTNAGIYDATSKNDLETVGNAQISTAISAKWGSGSMYFDGTGDWLQLPASDIYAFGSGDYTVEAWANFTSINNTTLQIIFMSGSTGGNSFYFHVDGNQISVGTTAAFISNQATTITTSSWYHIAACRSGTTLRLFVNGTQAGSNVTDTTNWTASGNARIGANESGSQTVFGYIQDLRVTKGYARYTANFTPPTAAFPIQ